MSAATRRSLDPTNLNNFVNPLRLPGNEGLFGFLDASDAPVSVMAREERVRVLFRARVRTGLPQPPQQGDGGDHLDAGVHAEAHQGDARAEGPEPPYTQRECVCKETGRSSRLGVSPAPHLALRIFTSFKGFFFLLAHPALRLFAPSTGFFLLFCAQLAHLFFGGVVLGCVGAHRWWPPSQALGTPTVTR